MQKSSKHEAQCIKWHKKSVPSRTQSLLMTGGERETEGGWEQRGRVREAEAESWKERETGQGVRKNILTSALGVRFLPLFSPSPPCTVKGPFFFKIFVVFFVGLSSVTTDVPQALEKGSVTSSLVTVPKPNQQGRPDPLCVPCPPGTRGTDGPKAASPVSQTEKGKRVRCRPRGSPQQFPLKTPLFPPCATPAAASPSPFQAPVRRGSTSGSEDIPPASHLEGKGSNQPDFGVGKEHSAWSGDGWGPGEANSAGDCPQGG